ncbi:MAG: response regulator, partial [Proteobacteria bacterium]
MSENKLLLTSFPITPQPAMAHSKPFVLLVDDEKRTLKLFAKNFSTFFPILTASSAEEGIDLMTKNEVAVLISDQRMPSKDGTMMLHYSSIHHPRTVKILTTAYEDYDILVNAVNEFSIFGFFTKPWDPTQIIKTVTNALDIYTGGRLSTSTSSIYSAHQHDRRIVVDPNHLQEIVSLISVFQSQTKNIFQNPGSCTIKQAGDDVIICSQDSSDPASTFSLSLKDLRKSIQLIHSIDPNSFMSEEAKPPLLPINREPKQNLSSHIVYSSVRLTQLGSYLRTVRVQAEQGVVTRIRPKTGHTAKFRQRILEI